MIQTLEEYRELAARTLNTEAPPYNLMIHMDAGIVGELGELIDALKKHIIYSKELDEDNIREEFGDIMWYIAGRHTLNKISCLSWENYIDIVIGIQEDILNEYYNGDYNLYNLCKQENNTSYKLTILKYLVYNQPDQWYEDDYNIGFMLALAMLFKYSKEDVFEILTENINKLKLRYPDKYSDQDAIERKDKL